MLLEGQALKYIELPAALPCISDKPAGQILVSLHMYLDGIS